MPPIGTAAKLRERATQQAKRAWREMALLFPLMIGVIIVYRNRVALFGIDTPVRILAGIALASLGWASARTVGRLAAPALTRRRIDTAGPIGFLVRLLTVSVTLVVALNLVGVDPATLAAGGAVTAVVIGLAAQQTLGNFLAGVVLLSARPFQLGDTVRFQSGALAGFVEGVVVGLGLLHTTLARGQDRILVPNSVVLNSAVVPLREPAAVDLRAQLRPGVTPTDLQTLLEEHIDTPLRGEPHIDLEEIVADGIIVRVVASPALDENGPQLANEVVDILHAVTANGEHDSISRYGG